MAGRNGDGGSAWLLLATLAAPALVVVAALAARLGGVDLDIARDLLVLRIGPFLALIGVIAAVLGLVLTARSRRRRWIPALAGLVIAGATATGFVVQQQRLSADAPTDVSTDPASPPGYGRLVMSARRGAAPVPAMSGVCDGVQSLLTQVAPQDAEAALTGAGFAVAGTSPFRVEGSREGFWFGLTHDAVIRIRPGRTDVRVTARDGRPQGDEACRLAAAILDRLATS